MVQPIHVNSSTFAEQVAQTPVPIFHGTRESLAQQIIRDGFAPLPIAKQIETIASKHDMPLQMLLDDLHEHQRFAVVDPRPDTVFVTADEVKAGSWADRAPEATWEALWAVYRIQHPELGAYWNNSQEGHLWVRAQRLSDPPAVLESSVPLGALRNRFGDSTAADGI